MDKVLYCDKCDICVHNKHNPVWGYGNENADIMFVGEAPGATERRLGLPFVGTSGKAFRRMLDLYGFNDNNCYITNVIKCRPPANRTPDLLEIVNCIPYLGMELNVVKPKIVVLVGNTALRTFYNNFNLSISKNNARYDVKGNRLLIGMYHPSYILRNQDMLVELEKTMDLILYFYRLIHPMHVTKL